MHWTCYILYILEQILMNTMYWCHDWSDWCDWNIFPSTPSNIFIYLHYEFISKFKLISHHQPYGLAVINFQCLICVFAHVSLAKWWKKLRRPWKFKFSFHLDLILFLFKNWLSWIICYALINNPEVSAHLIQNKKIYRRDIWTMSDLSFPLSLF